MALHAGQLMYGNVGSLQRLDFTVTGATVNEVVRLETLCKRLNVALIVSEDLPLPAETSFVGLGRHALAGVGREIEVFTVPAGG
jgi:adenylate cyclase